MRLIIAILVCIHISVFSRAQKVREVTIFPGQDHAKSFPAKDRYKYPEFQDGYVITPDGKRSQRLKLNFDEVAKLPQFINEKRDSLYLDKDLAEYVQIKSTTYFHAKDYYEIIETSPTIKMAIVRSWRLARIETPYESPRDGQKTKTIARSGSNVIYSPSRGKMVPNENTVYARDSTYYFIDAKGKVQKANRKGIVKLWPAHEAVIESFVEKEQIDFDKEDDLSKLFDFFLQMQSN